MIYVIGMPADRKSSNRRDMSYAAATLLCLGAPPGRSGSGRRMTNGIGPSVCTPIDRRISGCGAARANSTTVSVEGTANPKS